VQTLYIMWRNECGELYLSVMTDFDTTVA